MDYKKLVKVADGYCWYGDDKPLKQIISQCNQILKGLSEFDNPDYEFDADEKARFDLYKWVKEVIDQAEEWIQCNADNVSINGGEDW